MLILLICIINVKESWYHCFSQMLRKVGIKSVKQNPLIFYNCDDKIWWQRGGISLFTAIYISQVISGLIWTYLDSSGLDQSGLELVAKTIFNKSSSDKVIRNSTSTKLIKETSDLLKKQSLFTRGKQISDIPKFIVNECS